MSTLYYEVEGRINSDEAIELNGLVEQIWHDLDGQMPRARIRQVAIEVATEFHAATVTTYIPLLIRRGARERLRREISGNEAK